MSRIDQFSLSSGRMLREDDAIINQADLLWLQTVRERAFMEGRRKRASEVLALTTEEPVRWIQFNINDDIDLIFSRIIAVEGDVDYEVFAGAQITNPVGFTTPVSIYPSNTKSGVPNPASVVTAFIGNSAVASGKPNVTIKLRAGTASSEAVSRSEFESLPRGFGPTAAYARFTKVSMGDMEVVAEYEFDQF